MWSAVLNLKCLNRDQLSQNGNKRNIDGNSEGNEFYGTQSRRLKWNALALLKT